MLVCRGGGDRAAILRSGARLDPATPSGVVRGWEDPRSRSSCQSHLWISAVSAVTDEKRSVLENKTKNT